MCMEKGSFRVVVAGGIMLTTHQTGALPAERAKVQSFCR